MMESWSSHDDHYIWMDDDLTVDEIPSGYD